LDAVALVRAIDELGGGDAEAVRAGRGAASDLLKCRQSCSLVAEPEPVRVTKLLLLEGRRLPAFVISASWTETGASSSMAEKVVFFLA
jgi:hypothetical protein